MKKAITILLVIFLSGNIFGQTNMLIRKTDGTLISYPITEIDSIYYQTIISTSCGDPIVDIDGNTYNTIAIGSQCWMQENLRTTHYADGSPISGYLWNDNDSVSNAATFGALYSWNAMMNGETSSNNNPSEVQGACPDGWHVPSDNEIEELEVFLGMSQTDADDTGWRGSNQASKLSSDNSLWNAGALTDNAAFEESGFNALPSGYYNNSFHGVSNYFFMWSSTQTSSTNAVRRQFTYSMASPYKASSPKTDKYSIRCVKD